MAEPVEDPAQRALNRMSQSARARARRAADIEQLGLTIDRQLARVGERVESTRRAYAKAQGDYAELIEARTLLRGLL